MVRILFIALALPVTLAAAPPEVHLLSPETEKICRQLVPETTDPVFEELKKKNIIFYTETETVNGKERSVMPLAYQKWDTGVVRQMAGIHNARHNISARVGEPFGNANREFPWAGPAGLDWSPNTGHFKFVYLPSAIEVGYRRMTPPRSNSGEPELPSVVWSYPEGTVFCEVLTIRDADKHDLAFEVRTRTKKDGKWEPMVYRPFPTLKSLQEAASKLYAEDSKLVPEGYASAFMDLKAGKPAVPCKSWRVSDYNHPTSKAVNVEGTDWTVPALAPAMVRRLLQETKFQKDFGDNWTKGEAYAVTSKEAYNVVPGGYKGGYFAVGKKNCMVCHEGTLKHADEFDAPRDWYGRVRGSDNIFSFHPFDPECVSSQGFGLGVKWRKELVDAGLLVGEKK